MLNKQTVLNIAKKYCNDDGLVVDPIPQQLVDALKHHGLIRGINDGRPASPEGFSARWYVILNESVRSEVMPIFRAERKAKKKEMKQSI